MRAMSQSYKVSSELSLLGSRFPDPAAVVLASSSERRSCLETQQDELPSLPIPAKPAP